MNNRDELWADILDMVKHPDQYDPDKMRRDFDALIDAECAEAVARQQRVHNQVLNAVTEGLARWVIR